MPLASQLWHSVSRGLKSHCVHGLLQMKQLYYWTGSMFAIRHCITMAVLMHHQTPSHHHSSAFIAVPPRASRLRDELCDLPWLLALVYHPADRSDVPLGFTLHQPRACPCPSAVSRLLIVP